MARWEFRLPDIGEGVTEGEIVGWRVSEGDDVKEDQAVVEIMTDKATVTITAPRAGTVVETRGHVGDVVPVHDVLVVFELEGARPPAPGGEDRAEPAGRPHANGAPVHPGAGATHGAAAHVGATASPARDLMREGEPAAVGSGPGAAPPGMSGSTEYFNENPLATPATRKLARDHDVDLRQVPPTGPQGRVTLTDVEAFVREHAATDARETVAVAPGRTEEDAPVAASSPAAPAPAAVAVDPGMVVDAAVACDAGVARDPARARGAAVAGEAGVARDAGVVADERIPLAGLRRRIAQKMAQATRTAAHFTFVEECDATALRRLRERLKADVAGRGAKLSFLPFIVKAVVAALRRHPGLNASLDEAANEIVLKRAYNIGIATATDAGLVVPVVRNADRKGIVAIASEIEHLAAAARAGTARREDLQGSTFTITSLGSSAGLLATPIINYPEVAILGVHRIKEKPVVRRGRIVVGEVMLLSLSFDHRVVDGHVGAAFAYEVIGYLEQPERLLLEMV